jgi:L-alanine-DL-glutamate epimerase-like enolase superfamily enzyme
MQSETAAALVIRRVDPIPVVLPLKKPILMGGGQRFERSQTLLVRIESAAGMVGWGEASAAPTMTGDLLPGMVAAVRDHLAPLLIGRNACDRARLGREAALALIGNTGAKAACDLALFDLVGRHLGIGVGELLGGSVRDSVLTMCLLGNPDIAQDVADASAYAAQGYRFFKLKVGVKTIEAEIEAARAVRAAVGAEAILCADANMGLTFANARRYVEGVADAGLAFLEQPFRDHDLATTLALARISPVPLCADESAHSLESIMEWQRAGAIGGVNLKTIKLGGTAAALRAAIVADSLGLAIVLASKIAESSIGTAGLVHLGYCVPNLDWGISPTSHYLADDLVREPLHPARGDCPRPRGPGLGVDVDERAVERYRAQI